MIFDGVVFSRRRTVEGNGHCRFENLSITLSLSNCPLVLILSGDLKYDFYPPVSVHRS